MEIIRSSMKAYLIKVSSVGMFSCSFEVTEPWEHHQILKDDQDQQYHLFCL